MVLTQKIILEPMSINCGLFLEKVYIVYCVRLNENRHNVSIKIVYERIYKHLRPAVQACNKIPDAKLLLFKPSRSFLEAYKHPIHFGVKKIKYDNGHKIVFSTARVACLQVFLASIVTVPTSKHIWKTIREQLPSIHFSVETLLVNIADVCIAANTIRAIESPSIPYITSEQIMSLPGGNLPLLFSQYE